MSDEEEAMPETEETDGSTFVGEESPDMGMGESFTPTGTVEELPPPEPISGCECDQKSNTPIRDHVWLLGLCALVGLRRRVAN